MRNFSQDTFCNCFTALAKMLLCRQRVDFNSEKLMNRIENQLSLTLYFILAEGIYEMKNPKTNPEIIPMTTSSMAPPISFPMLLWPPFNNRSSLFFVFNQSSLALSEKNFRRAKNKFFGFCVSRFVRCSILN